MFIKFMMFFLKLIILNYYLGAARLLKQNLKPICFIFLGNCQKLASNSKHNTMFFLGDSKWLQTDLVVVC